ncbi:DUF4279 domain-containing protein [Hymenobacter sp. APR13]|uniref:DUF4279 domain-containing protein n=1 Tax=Hymenobacter sp. APR13 TaxID=1356852 RepID=UPI0018CF90ED|nr:DUF4279 domain-containing protein [Hymenobacter sp. APR13]
MEVELVEQLPKLEGIVVKQDIGRATVYVAVKGEPFYIGVEFDIAGAIEINAVLTEPRIGLSYLATSEEFDSEFLLSLTQLPPTEIIKKGDWFPNNQWRYSYSSLSYEATDAPGSFEDKLNEFLAYLEKDISGINALSRHTGADDLLVTVWHHISNGNFTQLYLTKGHVARLAKLGLSVTFDLYARGQALK